MGKIIKLEELTEGWKQYKLSGHKVGLCCGGYDLLHPGHMMHFASAKKLCNILAVAVTSDEFVGKRKGNGRPVFNENLRAYSVSQLISVDFAFICPYQTAVEAINLIKPDYYIKGPDYINSQEPNLLLEKKAIIDAGGEMKFTADEKFSTTEIIRYIKQNL